MFKLRENNINYYNYNDISRNLNILSFNQFNSPTFKNKSKETYEYFTELLRYSKKCIFLDGELN